MEKKALELREEHNRQIQTDIDLERKAINDLKKKKNEYSPKIQNLEWELEQINTEIRRIDIDMDCRENRIKVLSDRFWK